ncbi:MAG: copper oxidase [Chryseobacterium sp.]|nr:MAG: copper oxidase [Chryseobacterium sp.]
MKKWITFLLLGCFSSVFAQTENAAAERLTDEPTLAFGGNVVRYDLYVKDTIVNLTGKKRRAIATNGKLVAPTLHFTEGDIAEIYLHNQLKNENTGLHWHGVILPNEQDGVTYLTTKPVKPGETHLYRFRVSQNGTYWYHSHEKLQQQIGMNGMLVFHRRDAKPDNRYAMDIPVLIGEWSDEKPEHIMRRLHMDNTDWYAIKKGAVQSYSEAIKERAFGVKLLNEWKRMKAMDVSDVYYDKFLINGETSSQVANLKAGDRVRLRVVNGGSSSYFWVNYAGGKITILGSDGNRVEPVEVDRVILGTSESYDIEVTLPSDGSFELRATPEDRSGFASLWLGAGEKKQAPVLPKLMYFEGMKMMNSMMLMSGDMKPMNMTMSNRSMDMNSVMYPEIPEAERRMTMKHMDEMMGDKKKAHDAHSADDHHMMDHSNHGDEPAIVSLDYNMLKSPSKTTLPMDNVRELRFNLEGNMNHYLWTFDNKTVTETDKILIKRGETVRIVLYNNSMMRHPMHLHGHDFRVVNEHGDYAPLKNVVDIMPMETTVLEFPANQDGDWFFHCHILYHMMAGMGRIFEYENSAPNPQLPDKAAAWKMFLKDNRMQGTMGMLGVESNMLHAEAMAMFGPRWTAEGEFHTGWEKNHYNGEVIAGRYLGKFQWALPYVGVRAEGVEHKDANKKTWFGQKRYSDDTFTFAAGIQYVLPWLMVADASVDNHGKFRLKLGREDVPVSPRIRWDFSVSSDKVFDTRLRYIVQKWLQVSANYQTDMGLGAGLVFTY